MYKRNDGTEPTNALQNQFTAYRCIAALFYEADAERPFRK